MGLLDALAGKPRKRSDFEVASEIASMLEQAIRHGGPGILRKPGVSVAINAMGARGFSLWTSEPEEARVWVNISTWPQTRAVLDVFDGMDPATLPPDFVAQALDALLPPALDQLAIEVWRRFKMIQQGGGHMPPPLPRTPPPLP